MHLLIIIKLLHCSCSCGCIYKCNCRVQQRIVLHYNKYKINSQNQRHNITKTNKMLNNYTDEDISYECCSVVQPASNGNGALLIGDFNSATNQQKIKQYNIKTIITAAINMEHLQIPNSVTHITYPLLDSNSENIKRLFDQSTTTIRNSLRNGGVLVHCAAGISRSATLVIAYIMKTRNLGFRQAISVVRTKRNVRPNLGFQRQLKQYQKQLLDSSQNNNKLSLKKTLTEKMANQRRTSYNRSSHLGRAANQYLKFEPRTAEQTGRKKNQFIRRAPFPHSQSRPRDRKNFKVRPLGKQGICVVGQAHCGVKELRQLNLQDSSIGYSQQIKPPVIQNHHKNALNNGWLKFQIKKHY